MAAAKKKNGRDKRAEPQAHDLPVNPLDRFFGLTAAGTSAGTEFHPL